MPPPPQAAIAALTAKQQLVFQIYMQGGMPDGTE
jgi:hypothetical protein